MSVQPQSLCSLCFLLELQLDACESARPSESEPRHPLLDRVRQCSTKPDQAAAFFAQVFHPFHKVRSRAVFVEEALYSLHPACWIVDTTAKMREEVGVDYWALAAAAEADRYPKAKHGCLPGFCAAFVSCFAGASRTLEAESCLPSEKSSPKVERDRRSWWNRCRNVADRQEL